MLREECRQKEGRRKEVGKGGRDGENTQRGSKGRTGRKKIKVSAGQGLKKNLVMKFRNLSWDNIRRAVNMVLMYLGWAIGSQGTFQNKDASRSKPCFTMLNGSSSTKGAEVGDPGANCSL